MSMSTDRAFERALVAAMVEDVGQPPERLLAEILGETQGIAPAARAVVALVAAPPMALPARVVVGVPRSRLLLVAAALLLVGAALLAGALLRTPVAPPDAWTGWGGGAARAGDRRVRPHRRAAGPVDVHRRRRDRCDARDHRRARDRRRAATGRCTPSTCGRASSAGARRSAPGSARPRPTARSCSSRTAAGPSTPFGSPTARRPGRR